MEDEPIDLTAIPEVIDLTVDDGSPSVSSQPNRKTPKDINKSPIQSALPDAQIQLRSKDLNRVIIIKHCQRHNGPRVLSL